MIIEILELEAWIHVIRIVTWQFLSCEDIVMLFSVLILIMCFCAFLWEWSNTCNRALVFTPFLMFALYEMVWAWPATIVAQSRKMGDAIAHAGGLGRVFADVKSLPIFLGGEVWKRILYT